ncbi:MAG: DUF3892 domain-containing protein [Flavobacterium sp.]|nr:MAG: DUF3892 domain-containing protein [Flavobacterium sp.]
MTKYRISGVWKDANGIITDYAFHTVTETGTTRAARMTKRDAIALLERSDNSATTWIWNYSQVRWNIGETVMVIDGMSGKYLRSNPDNKLTDNLGHLINFDWIYKK